MSFRFRVDQLIHKDAVAVWLLNYDGNKTLIAKPFVLEFVESPEGYQLPEPTLEMRSNEALQMIRALMDALAESDYIERKTRSEKRADAMKEHLEDMRKMTDRLMRMVEEKL